MNTERTTGDYAAFFTGLRSVFGLFLPVFSIFALKTISRPGGVQIEKNSEMYTQFFHAHSITMVKNTNFTHISERTTKDYIFFQRTTKELQDYAKNYTSILHPERTTVVPKGLHLVTLYQVLNCRQRNTSIERIE